MNLVHILPQPLDSHLTSDFMGITNMMLVSGASTLSCAELSKPLLHGDDNSSVCSTKSTSSMQSSNSQLSKDLASTSPIENSATSPLAISLTDATLSDNPNQITPTRHSNSFQNNNVISQSTLNLFLGNSAEINNSNQTINAGFTMQHHENDTSLQNGSFTLNGSSNEPVTLNATLNNLVPTNCNSNTSCGNKNMLANEWSANVQSSNVVGSPLAPLSLENSCLMPRPIAPMQSAALNKSSNALYQEPLPNPAVHLNQLYSRKQPCFNVFNQNHTTNQLLQQKPNLSPLINLDMRANNFMSYPMLNRSMKENSQINGKHAVAPPSSMKLNAPGKIVVSHPPTNPELPTNAKSTTHNAGLPVTYTVHGAHRHSTNSFIQPNQNNMTPFKALQTLSNNCENNGSATTVSASSIKQLVGVSPGIPVGQNKENRSDEKLNANMSESKKRAANTLHQDAAGSSKRQILRKDPKVIPKFARLSTPPKSVLYVTFGDSPHSSSMITNNPVEQNQLFNLYRNMNAQPGRNRINSPNTCYQNAISSLYTNMNFNQPFENLSNSSSNTASSGHANRLIKPMLTNYPGLPDNNMNRNNNVCGANALSSIWIPLKQEAPLPLRNTAVLNRNGMTTGCLPGTPSKGASKHDTPCYYTPNKGVQPSPFTPCLNSDNGNMMQPQMNNFFSNQFLIQSTSNDKKHCGSATTSPNTLQQQSVSNQTSFLSLDGCMPVKLPGSHTTSPPSESKESNFLNTSSNNTSYSKYSLNPNESRNDFNTMMGHCTPFPTKGDRNNHILPASKSGSALQNSNVNSPCKQEHLEQQPNCFSILIPMASPVASMNSTYTPIVLAPPTYSTSKCSTANNSQFGQISPCNNTQTGNTNNNFFRSNAPLPQFSGESLKTHNQAALLNYASHKSSVMVETDLQTSRPEDINSNISHPNTPVNILRSHNGTAIKNDNDLKNIKDELQPYHTTPTHMKPLSGSATNSNVNPVHTQISQQDHHAYLYAYSVNQSGATLSLPTAGTVGSHTEKNKDIFTTPKQTQIHTKTEDLLTMPLSTDSPMQKSEHSDVEDNTTIFTNSLDIIPGNSECNNTSEQEFISDHMTNKNQLAFLPRFSFSEPTKPISLNENCDMQLFTFTQDTLILPKSKSVSCVSSGLLFQSSVENTQINQNILETEQTHINAGVASENDEKKDCLLDEPASPKNSLTERFTRTLSDEVLIDIDETSLWSKSIAESDVPFEDIASQLTTDEMTLLAVQDDEEFYETAAQLTAHFATFDDLTSSQFVIINSPSSDFQRGEGSLDDYYSMIEPSFWNLNGQSLDQSFFDYSSSLIGSPNNQYDDLFNTFRYMDDYHPIPEPLRS